MATVEKSITVHVPVRTCYNQWTQFEEFPRFMEGVEQVRQIDDRHLHWRATVGGRLQEWQAEITLQEPDHAIGWRSIAGAENAGRVNFATAEGTSTRITLRMIYTPDGPLEQLGDWLGVLNRRVEGDLKRFKDFIESRKQETGSWRGEIHGAKVRSPVFSGTEPGPDRPQLEGQKLEGDRRQERKSERPK